MIWVSHGRNFYAVVKGPEGGTGLCLFVEWLPGRSWHWAVWNPGNRSKMARQGTADTAEAAERDAELSMLAG
jgi:hypothetical protein